MKKRNLLLLLVLLLTFIGGFYTGVWVSPYNKSHEFTEQVENSKKNKSLINETKKNLTREKQN